MSQATQQEAVPAQAKGRKDWEWFWRIIAFLMLLVTGWVAWVAYQIAPRSVVTPLAYATPVKRINTQPVAPATTADPAREQAQAAPRSGVDQPAAAIPKYAPEGKGEQKKEEGLRLATEISTPPAAKPGIPK